MISERSQKEDNRSLLQRPTPFFFLRFMTSFLKPGNLHIRLVLSIPALRCLGRWTAWIFGIYEKLSPIEEAISTHLCPARSNSAAKLPSKPCWTIARTADKAFMAAGQAASALHMMAVLQVYQAKTLGDMDEGGLGSEVFKELRRANDCTLRVIKTMAQAIGCSMGSPLRRLRTLRGWHCWMLPFVLAVSLVMRWTHSWIGF